MESEAINARRKAREPPQVNDYVWVLRPKSVGGNKTKTWWEGPYPVVKRVGESSYQIRLPNGTPKDVHMDQIKPFIGELLQEGGRPLIFHGTDPKKQNLGPRMVENIRAHQLSPAGELEFLTHWVGTPDEEDTWEPVGSFLTGCSPQWLEYCYRKNLGVDLVDSLDGPPVEENEED